MNAHAIGQVRSGQYKGIHNYVCTKLVHPLLSKPTIEMVQHLCKLGWSPAVSPIPCDDVTKLNAHLMIGSD